MKIIIGVVAVLTVLHFTVCLSGKGLLVLDYYEETCPLATEIIRREVEIAVIHDPRMAASLLRLHFHDCFVMGCDASVLLDSFGDMVSEKQAGPNLNSLRGFEVIDRIKYLLEEACPYTVSCADILAIAARDAVALIQLYILGNVVLFRLHKRDGPTWEVWLGRKDSFTASFVGANTYIPNPNSSLEMLIANFNQQGLGIGDLVALSGSHTFGVARCTSFRSRVYQDNLDPYYDHYQRSNVYRRILRSICPEVGGDNQLAPLDLKTSKKFDNFYFQNLLQQKGLLHSDNVLVTEDQDGNIRWKVSAYARDQGYFFESFAESVVKMGNINVLTGAQGEIRRNCRFVNGK